MNHYNYSPETQIIEIPGNDQLDHKEIYKLIEWGLENPNSTLTTYRTNQFVRPPIKVFFSKILQWVVNRMLIKGAKDITANFVFPLKIIDEKFPYKWGHAFGLWILYSSFRKKIRIVQLPIMLKSDISQRLYSRSSRKYPRLKNIFEVIFAIIEFTINNYRFSLEEWITDANKH